MSKDLYCGIKFIWSWDYRFWSWFTSHGVQTAWTGGKFENSMDNAFRYIVAPDRVFDKIYHLGPFKIFIGVLK